jgi:uncharacterized protein (TIGR03086 family)
VNGGSTLLEQAVSYAGRSVLDVTPALLPGQTPCRGWNLDMLLRHASESLAALHEATVTGHVALIPARPDRDPAADPAGTFRDRAGRLLAARASTGGRPQVVDVGDLPLPAIAIEYAGAIEIAVHGWDISQACGQNRPIPDMLAASLLAIAPLLIPETGRHPCSARRSPRRPRPVRETGSSPASTVDPVGADNPVTARQPGVLRGPSVQFGIWLREELAVGHCRDSCHCDSPMLRCCAYSAVLPCSPVPACRRATGLSITC